METDIDTSLIVADDQLGLSHLSATICAELAAELIDAEGVKVKYELSEPQWQKLKRNPAFRSMLREALGKFQGDIGAPARIKMKAEILLEDSLPVLDRMVHDKEGAASNKLDSIKQLIVLAEKAGGSSSKDKHGFSGAGFNVSIHINTGGGNDAEPQTIIDIPAEED